MVRMKTKYLSELEAEIETKRWRVSLGNEAKERFWVSGHGLGSERGKTKSERTRKAESSVVWEGIGFFVCLKFLQSSKCWVLYFVFIYFLLEFQPDSKPVSTWFDLFRPIRSDSTWIGTNLQTKKRTRHWHSWNGVNCHIARPCVSSAGVVALELHLCFLRLY